MTESKNQQAAQRARDIVTVTAVCADGAQWGWPGEPVFRYEGQSGWAWVPCSAINEQVGDVLDMNADTIETALVSRAAAAIAGATP